MKITKKFLYQNYVVLKKSSESIGKECGCTGRNIRYLLEKYGFKEEMTNRKSIVNINRPPSNKGITVTNNPKLGRYYVSHKGKSIPRARMIMEIHLGRSLQRKEIIHHKDGNPFNDSIDNLEIMTQNNHIKLHNPHKFRKKIK